MSIVNEALKKAGKEKSALEPATFNAGRLEPSFDAGFKKSRLPFNWGPLFVIMVLLLITGPIIAPLFSSPFRKGELTSQHVSSTKNENPQAALTTNRKEQFAVEETPLFQPTASPFGQPPYLILSGIATSPNASDAYCIINNKIIKPGESIQDAKLLSITPDQVVLDFRGQKISLNLSK